MVSKQDKTLVMVTVVFWAIMFMILMAARVAEARVALNEPAAYSVGSDGCSMYVDGCAFANQMSGVSTRDADVERSYYLSIKDGAAMGIDAFGLDMTANTTHSTWLLTRLSAAMKRYNGENEAAKKCIFASYRAAGGEALAMFNAADSNNSSDSAYCAVDGKPLIGVRQAATCVNPLSGVVGSSVVLATASGATDSVPTKACVDTWKASGASRVIAYQDASSNMNMAATAKATATAAGAEFAYGIPSSWARQCGGPECKGPAATSYTFRDGKGYLAATAALQASLRDPEASVVFPYAFPGEYDEDVSWEGARICDSNDTVAKSFTCPNVPTNLRGTIPTGNAGLSNSNKSHTKAGFNRIGQWWADKFRARSDPASKPFVAWSYREHPFSLSGSGMAICPAATVAADTKSLGGTSGAGADNIYLTSYSAEAVRVRVSVGAATLGTFTLPARQLDLETDARQTAIALGSARGRPKFEVLDSAGNVITSRDGDVTYTDTPTQRTGTGRNFSVYADAMPIPVGTAAAKASVVKVSGDRAEGNSGTSVSTFRVTLDKPASVDSVVNWSVTSTAANATDFYQVEEVTSNSGPQCTNISPPKPAADIGATQLVFCDDFSTDTVARGSTAADRNINGTTKKWTTEYPIFYSGSQPAGDFRHDASAGTMRIAPSVNKAQSAMQSVGVRDGKVTGFYIGPSDKFYVEYRFKLEKGDGGQPALWSMDMCHWLSRPYPCSEQSSLNEHLEFDVFEYNNGKATVHKWREKDAGGVGVTTGWADSSTHINCAGPTAGYTIGTFNTFGWQANGKVATFFKDNVKTGSLGPTSCGIPWDLQAKGRYPLLIGGKVNDVIVVDYVRVWKAP